MALTFSSISSFILLVWALRRLLNTIASKKRRPYPPGPKPLPLIGNLFDLPISNAALVYTEWTKKYNSPILYAEALGNRIVILNDLKDVAQLLENPDRARNYADRPVIPIVEVMGWSNNVAIMPYGDVWRQHRRIIQNNFNNPKSVQKLEPIQTKKVRQLLQGLFNTPEKFEAHSKMFSTSLTISLTHGYEIKSIDEPCVTMADEALLMGVRLLVPGASLMNVFPVLQHVPEWFPGASARKTAGVIRRMTDEIVRFPLEYVKQSFEAGTAVPSLVADFYEKMYTIGASEVEEEMIKNVAYTVYGAASDTTISFTGSFFYLMAANPQSQRQAHAEIDRVLGSKRLPTLADRDSLPYLEAMYREVLRLRPPFPLGVPHKVIEDDLYKGYLIPKGTTVFTNMWAMSRDEVVYPDPDIFKPERYFDAEGKLMDENLLGYGFGRRICAGKRLASSTVWLMMASVLACFEITPRKDKDGNTMEVNGDIEDNGMMK
ncbi:Cytochrome P450 monooxygenase COX2 [Psilocybe cubensis]|uniref:Cytochrome P450 monooxygenase COX2 n=1 Tax=Psilocybe cubensis TaxID=181762 RepID=A0ACB8GRN1_PSICU|nr:Cytochrome P450 monooxygenase COX2 [Psilocybe cubensis]KAH9478398.1 Cytochrome P450 monooxygenase COX2 [Psilocybe cubensis]